VEHVVLYNVDNRLEEAEAATLVTQGMETLAAIPGVRSVAHGHAVRDARYRHCWLIRFAGDAVIASCRDHPDHVRYADQVFRPAAPERLTIDYQIERTS
jgi:fructose-bisphosphate aldolase class II